MKIEIGESLILSWLRHVKKCQVVQTNWKASHSWDFMDQDNLRQLMEESRTLFQEKYGYLIYKGTKTLEQLINQAEVDLIGIHYEDGLPHLYAVDVAFHEGGLTYGSFDETVSRVIKKIIRTAMCIRGSFGFRHGTIIFTAPKISMKMMDDLTNCIPDIKQLMNRADLNFDILIIGNVDFNNMILIPIMSNIKNVADTSELFMRSIQMYNMFTNDKAKN